MRINSYAKLNLFLRILGKREDGYHAIETVMQQIDLADEIICRESDKMKVVMQGVQQFDQENNLITKAYTLLNDEVGGRIPPQTIEVYKKIPLGSGLGGGSSNAVTMLKYWANHYLGDEVGEELLHAIAAKLGSDTNFFLLGKTALCEGRGEKVSPLPHKKLYFNLIFPGFSCFTPKVFSVYKHISKLTSVDWLEQWSKGNDLPTPENDLMDACMEVYPEIARMRTMLGGGVYLSGSGSTLYTVHQEEGERNVVYARLISEDHSSDLKIMKSES